MNLHDASVPVLLRYLEHLMGFVDTAEAHALSAALRIDELLDARLAPDMRPFADQVQIATHFTLRIAFALAGEAIPDPGLFAPDIAGLRGRARHADALLRSLDRARFEGAETRVLESRAGEALVRLPAAEFLFQYALPNFFFHVTTAYAILRSRGVPLGKQDFDGFHVYRTKPGPCAEAPGGLSSPAPNPGAAA